MESLSISDDEWCHGCQVTPQCAAVTKVPSPEQWGTTGRTLPSSRRPAHPHHITIVGVARKNAENLSKTLM